MRRTSRRCWTWRIARCTGGRKGLETSSTSPRADWKPPPPIATVRPPASCSGAGGLPEREPSSDQLLHRIGEGVHGLSLEEKPGARSERLQGSTAPKRDHRTTRGLGFERRDSKVLVGSENQRSRAIVEARQFLIGYLSEHLHVGRHCGAKSRTFLARANHPQRKFKSAERLDRDVQALVRRQGSDRKKVPALPASVRRKSGKPLQLHRGRHHLRLSAIKIGDLLGDVIAVGQKSVHAVGACAVPRLQRWAYQTRGGAGRP